MDCPAEENLIRVKLQEVAGIRYLDFDLPNRTLNVFHEGPADTVESALLSLGLGGRCVATQPAGQPDVEDTTLQKRLLLTVLAINFALFIVEVVGGWLAGSMGLVADSLDMLSDAFVYGISLLAIGSTTTRKKQVARLAGFFQLALAVLGFSEVLRRFFTMETPPDVSAMILISILALAGNAACLYLLQQSRSREAHMRASMIFTSNDVVVNLGVIVAGLLVYSLNSCIPDLVIGGLVFVIVLYGAIRILKLSR